MKGTCRDPRRPARHAGWAAVLSLTLGACAATGTGERPDWVVAKERQLWDMPGFLDQHPDVLHRKLGFMHEHDGDLARAAAEFRKAATYADKASQAMLAEMYFEGRGVPRDPALAYAWMDLAAERAYRVFLAKREQYWNALDASQRQAALDRGQELYAEYGDRVAKPRIERILQRARRNLMGSRGHSAGVAVVNIPSARGFEWFPGTMYYDPRYWKADRYFAWTDAIYGGWPDSRVEVGPLSPQPAPPSD